MTRFDHHNEELLLACVRQAQREVDAGESPTDAVVKAARELCPPRDMLPLMAQAINIGRQTYQREVDAAGQGILAKLAEFPLADIDEVVRQLYPARPTTPGQAKRASCVSSAYDQPPAPPPAPRIKQADARTAAPPVLSLAERPSADRVRRNMGLRDKLARTLDEARTAEAQARHDAHTALRRAAAWCKQALRISPAMPSLVAHAAGRQLGPGVQPVLEELSKEAGFSLTPPVGARGYDEEGLRVVKEAAVALSSLDQAIQARRAAEPPAATAPSSTVLRTDQTPGPLFRHKTAGLFSPVLAGVGAGLGAAMRPKDTGTLVGKVVDKLNDPQHEDRVRGIQAKAMLNDLMANDEVIRGYDPSDVAEAYNELAQLSPSAADRGALMRPLLRQRLTAGSLAPYEAQQIADIERTVRQTSSPWSQRNEQHAPHAG